MTTVINHFNPDYAVSPGAVLQERLEVMGVSQAEFARRCGRTPKLISEIIVGKAPVETETAMQFERVTGLHASIWLGIEADYRLHLARQDESRQLEQLVAWAKEFPVKELFNRSKISKPLSNCDTVNAVLSFFGVGSVDAWQSKYSITSVAYRHSPSFQSNPTALAAWLRLGEIEAEQTECAQYSVAAFRQSLTQIRTLTAEATGRNLAEAQRLCREAGVVLCFTQPFKGMALSGASRWLTPRKPIIQLSARHKTDDHLWFSLFHEAAHILRHNKKQVFIDGIRGTAAAGESEECEAETEADAWARDFLIPRAAWEKFASSFLGRAAEVRLFAEEQGIAPGIIVGRLQKENLLSWSRLNRLKRKLEWSETST